MWVFLQGVHCLALGFGCCCGSATISVRICSWVRKLHSHVVTKNREGWPIHARCLVTLLVDDALKKGGELLEGVQVLARALKNLCQKGVCFLRRCLIPCCHVGNDLNPYKFTDYQESAITLAVSKQLY